MSRKGAEYFLGSSGTDIPIDYYPSDQHSTTKCLVKTELFPPLRNKWAPAKKQCCTFESLEDGQH